jgi:hypothetical protein
MTELERLQADFADLQDRLINLQKNLEKESINKPYDYIIVEVSNGNFYCYGESEKLFNIAEKHRSRLTRRTALDEDCMLQDHDYIVIKDMKII